MNMLVNLKPFTMDGKPYHYKLGIKSKADSFDQKTKGLISLRPGYHTLIKVVTDITEISENFASLNQATRKCKLSHETKGFQFVSHLFSFYWAICIMMGFASSREGFMAKVKLLIRRKKADNEIARRKGE